MKKASLVIIAVTLVFCAFSGGFFIGRNANRSTIHIDNNRSVSTQTPTEESSPAATEPSTQPLSYPIDLNTATAEQLSTLPGIGQVLAQRIVDYRQEHGAFQSIAELSNVEGIGDKKLEAILDYIEIGGQS